MLVVMQQYASEAHIQKIIARLVEDGTVSGVLWEKGTLGFAAR